MNSGFCSCECPSDVWEEQRRKARKEHKCCECGETIERGEEYIYVSALYDGDWSSYHVCEYCDHDWDVLTKIGYCKTMKCLQETWKSAWKKDMDI